MPTLEQDATGGELPPLEAYANERQANWRGPEAKQRAPLEPPLDWSTLEGEPPPRTWWIQDWLGPWPTLTSGPGGAGKTRLWQTIATSLATGRPYLEAQCKPLKVLMWLCEETRDEVWRQQLAINRYFTLSMESLGNLCIVPRQGLENTLLDVAFGKPVFTPLLEQLREQVNDLKADVLVLDNLAQLFGGNANDAHQATYFVNAMAGLVRDRPFAPVMLGHIARAHGSEFAGAAAWENAVRMRWYVGPTLPDQEITAEDEPADSDVVYLARRKANYTAKDWRKLKFDNGVLIPEITDSGNPVSEMFRFDRADGVVLEALMKLTQVGIFATDGPTSPDYLPKQIMAKGFAQQHTRKELTQAMNRLMGEGRLKRGVVGKYSNRNPRFGLVVL
jgi:hypothetical protein